MIKVLTSILLLTSFLACSSDQNEDTRSTPIPIAESNQNNPFKLIVGEGIGKS